MPWGGGDFTDYFLLGTFFRAPTSHVQQHEIADYNEATLRLRLVHEPFLDSLERLATSTGAGGDLRCSQFCIGSISQG